MKNRRLLPSSLAFAAVVGVITVAAGALWAAPPEKKASPERPESVTGKSGDTRADKVQKWVADVFPYGEGPITVDEMTAYKTPGYRTFRASKKYTADTRMADRADVIVDDEGKVVLLGDIFVDEERAKAEAPQPIRSEADLAGATDLLRRYLRGGFKITLDPALDRKGWKGVKVLNDTGYGKYSMAGFVREGDGVVVFLGNAWDFKTPLVEQRKAFLKTADTPLQGSPDARVTIVEFSDMQCGFCKKRTLDFETLTAKLGKELTIKRYIKSFPLTNEHPWAFRAASAGRCFFQKEPSLFFRWKSNVYAKQDEMTVASLDAFAIDFAVANDISDTKFMGCYLQPATSEKILADLTEGFAARVRSTPTYFIDGVNVSWFSDNVMEEFLRKTYLKGAGLPLPTPVPTPGAKGPVKPPPPAAH
jgi:protein-disulfide isomerase